MYVCIKYYIKASYFANSRAPWAWPPHAQTLACAFAFSAPYSAADSQYNRASKKHASAKPSGTTTSATALEATRNITTDSSTASKTMQCSIRSGEFGFTPDHKQ